MEVEKTGEYDQMSVKEKLTFFLSQLSKLLWWKDKLDRAVEKRESLEEIRTGISHDAGTEQKMPFWRSRPNFAPLTEEFMRRSVSHAVHGRHQATSGIPFGQSCFCVVGLRFQEIKRRLYYQYFLQCSDARGCSFEGNNFYCCSPASLWKQPRPREYVTATLANKHHLTPTKPTPNTNTNKHNKQQATSTYPCVWQNTNKQQTTSNKRPTTKKSPSKRQQTTGNNSKQPKITWLTLFSEFTPL